MVGIKVKGLTVSVLPRRDGDKCRIGVGRRLYDHDILVKLLADRFDPASRVSAFRSRFHGRLRRHQEDADSFADAIMDAITTLNVTQPDVAIAVAERTSRDNLADTVEVLLADAGNTPRAGIGWPALRDNIEALLLGEAYEEVLRSEHRVIRQRDTTTFSERYLTSAKAAYPEPWDRITNQLLIALFAEGLIDKRMARDVGVVLRKATFRETINQTQNYAGIEATMNLRDDMVGTVVAVSPEVKTKKKETQDRIDDSGDTKDKDYMALAKQIASISSRLSEMKAGTR